MTAYKILCLENPLLDIAAHGDEALLKKYDLKANDAILADSKHLPLYDDLAKLNPYINAAGAAQNTARGAQYMLPPDSVLFIGAVGQDDAASTLDEACAKAGLKTEYLRLKEHPTGRCGAIITDNGQSRSLCTDLGAANHYTIEHLKQPHIWKHVEAAEIIFVGGYHLTVSPEAANALGEEAARRNVPYMFSLSAPFIPIAFGEQLSKALEYSDYVVGNETEAASWAETQGMTFPDGLSQSDKSEIIAKKMVGLPKKNNKRGRIVIVTQGSEPTIVATSDGQIQKFPVPKLEGDDIVDSTGAGDSFAGGFLAGLITGKSLEQCVDMGSWLARLGLKEMGPQYVTMFPNPRLTPVSI